MTNSDSSSNDPSGQPPERRTLDQQDYYRQWIDEGNLPALQGQLAIPAPNEPTVLYEGALDAIGDQKYRGTGIIKQVWSPRPSIVFTFEAQWTEKNVKSFKPAFKGPRERPFDDFSQLATPDGHISLATWITSFGTQSAHPLKKHFSGLVTRATTVGNAAPVAYALFLVPNFLHLRGDAVLWDRQDGGGGYNGRNVCVVGDWRITLDNVWVPFDEKYKSADDGYGITQTGRIERCDHAQFTESDASAVLSGLGAFLSFCVGRRISTFRLTGFSTQGKVWEVWDWPDVEAYEPRPRWFDRHTPQQLKDPLPEFQRLWNDHYWRKILSDLLHWYLAANAQAGAVEGAIALAQTGFELLCSVVLVEQYRWISEKAARDLPAEDKIRLLLRWAGLPTTIPAELGALAKCGKGREWDIPIALTHIRNKIVHPTRANREAKKSLTTEVVLDAWVLCMWVFELCILRLLGYQGSYSNRLRMKWEGQTEQSPTVSATFAERRN